MVEHVSDDVAVLEECRRALSRGGLLILGIPHEGGVIGRSLRRLHRRMYAEGEHVNFYSIERMRALLRSVGFVDIRLAKFGFLFPQYHMHVALTWCPWTFRLGHWWTQRCDTTADSLIFVARPSSDGYRAPARGGSN